MSSGSINEANLKLVFGDNSRGSTPVERASSSSTRFVRSQVQVALASESATGRCLSASEALATFGWDALLTASTEGSFAFVTDPREPATTLKSRREELGLNIRQVARAAGIEVSAVSNAETMGRRSPVRTLEKIAQALALDERVLGYLPRAKGDSILGVRLRELTTQRDESSFSPATVAGLSEAAWVIARQRSMSEGLGEAENPLVASAHQRDPHYGYPSWEKGFQLAHRTRALLGLGDEPISSVRNLIEITLGIPLVQLSLEGRFAGATLANDAARGVVINEQGANANVRVRRMTLCHELGHLLWDPDQRLNRLTVDDYDGIERDYRDAKHDPVEIRANAFAVAFLAPPAEVKRLVAQTLDASSAVQAVMDRFGISLSAARHHVRNMTRIDTSQARPTEAPQDDEWIAAENLTVDFFPITTTPISRRGRFANRVVHSYLRGLISSDTAAMMLKCEAERLGAHIEALRDLTTPSIDSFT